ncbi:hypothetical protein L226DRAFT_608637 [Lentinus tigrinus ALCF2SS1-7]|uniref:uncharacterized protein n=1 Tax=Lentinus tigrinus ALCF2SS1-7 TaxID=1328758 RepID=UPI001165F408|nr:hypothetical protein L226DRAFT_608637 [Lentinus tigrinus ALCF2SS1-7]
MADERTASNFTWYNSAIRNRQDVKTLTNMIQVRQWYLNEDESVPPQTHPVVRWSKLTPSVLASREKPLHPNDDIFEDWPAHVDPRAAPSHSDALSSPILGIDIWEHAFYFQYYNVKADYLTAIWNVINFKEVERRCVDAVKCA